MVLLNCLHWLMGVHVVSSALLRVMHSCLRVMHSWLVPWIPKWAVKGLLVLLAPDCLRRFSISLCVESRAGRECM